MKRTTTSLSAALIGGLSVPVLAGGLQDDSKTGWAMILADPPTSLIDAAGAQPATAPRVTLASAGGCNGLNDNGVANGLNGYSNATENVFGSRRTLLDDFEIPDGEAWAIDAMHHTHVWDSSSPGAGLGMELAIWSDSAGTPDEVIVATQMSTSYTEVATGKVFFSRDEAASWAGFDAIELDSGRYWFEATILGPENNFWITADQIDEECWVNYEDLGGLQRSSEQFGTASDVNWCLGGTIGVGSTNQFGLRHGPRGQAQLEAVGGTLTVSNIGASGDDGVGVELGTSSGGWLGHAAAPSGGEMVVTAIGARNGTPDLAFGSTTTTFATLTTISMDLTGLDATTYTRNLYLGNVLVDSVSGLSSGAIAASTADAVAGGDCLSLRTPDNVIYVVAIDVPVDVVGVGMADGIEMIPDAPTAGVESITSVEVTLANTGDLIVDDGALVMFGNEHRSAGGARMTTADGRLRVSNLGAGGDDGVRIGLDNAEAAGVMLLPLIVNLTPDRFHQTATGCFDETAGSDLGRSSFINGSGFTVLQADFAAISASNEVLIELYDDGAFVADIVRVGGGNTMLVFTDGVNPFPNLIDTGMTSAPGFSWQFDGDVDLRTGLQPGTSIGLGDEVRVIASDPDAPVTGLDSYGLTSSVATAIVITGEIVTGAGLGCGVTCDAQSGDTTGDGCVDFDDLRAIIAGWGSSGEPGFLGDATCDGRVTFADIVLVLSTWDQGCS